MVPTSTDSVYNLINELCENLLRENNPHETPNPACVKKFKSQAYEILLKKSSDFGYKIDEDFDPIRELNVQLFELRITSRKDYKNRKICENFQDHIQYFSDEPYFESDTGKNVLSFILWLRNSAQDESTSERCTTPPLLIPGPFTLYSGYKNNSHYPKDYFNFFPATEKLKPLQPLLDYDNPYLPRFLFQGQQKKLSQIEKKFGISKYRENATLTRNHEENTWGSVLGIDPNACRFFNRTSRTSGEVLLKEKKASVRSISQKKSYLAIENSSTPSQQTIFSWNWEFLGDSELSLCKPFASELNCSLYFENLLQDHIGDLFDAKVVPINRFIFDLKALSIGIQSDSFTHDENIIFQMLPNITVPDVSPDVIKNFVSDFLECGTCYKRLQIMTAKRDHKLKFDGFIFKALCGAVEDYLIMFRQYVISVEDKTLLQFHCRMKAMMKQISLLYYTLATYPQVDETIRAPMGSQFLGYLYKEITRVTQKDIMMLLIYILKRCCHVYFKHLQKWIFYGLLDDPCNELFICFVDHYRQFTKYFFDKAYFVRKELVPGFFQGYEDQILQCGKYTMLLKAFNPNHPLFNIEYPSITVCLSFKELEAMEERCKKYVNEAQDVCGKPVTARDIYNKRYQSKKEFFRMVSEKCKKNLELWTAEQISKAAVQAAEKKKRFDEIQAQLQETRDRKLSEKKAEIELELKLLKESKDLADKRLMQENLEIKKRIDYYQELTALAIKRKQKPEDEKLSSRTVVSEQNIESPVKTDRTEFESCFGEEESESIYEECISSEFLEKFKKTEEELLKLTLDGKDEKEAVYDGDIIQIKIDPVENNNPQEDQDNQNMKKSESDFFNSNIQDLNVISELVRNRNKNLGSTLDYVPVDTSNMLKVETNQPLTGAQKNKLKVLTEVYNGDIVQVKIDSVENNNPQEDQDNQNMKKSEYDFFNTNIQDSNVISELVRNRNKNLGSTLDYVPVDTSNMLKVETNQPLTEAQKNKLKVLTEEFGYKNSEKLDDFNSNSISNQGLNTTTLTDCVKNRLKMMQTDLFAEFNKDSERKLLNLDLNTERSRNRRKVLESEFHILTGIATHDATPMSTTSDSSSVNDDKFEDIVNANTPKLTVDISVTKNIDIESMKLDIPTAVVEETPECALNTAGLLARNGFNFTTDVKDESAAILEVYPTTSSGLALSPFNIDHSSPYKRCEELVKSNFKCKPLTPFIGLRQNEANDFNERIEGLNQKQKELIGLSAITLTEFLQKSVIIPLNVHLEIMNNEIMKVFLEDLDIIGHFESLRNYFFLMDGEFGSFICDGLIGKLEKGATPNDLLNYQMLHTILDNALGSSIIGNDKNAENLSFIVTELPNKFDLTSPSVLSNLSLSYRVNWPVNLILNPEALEQYADIFKYLMKVRRISWVLEESYQMLKEIVKKNGKDILLSPQYRKVQQIRQKFFHFVHALKNHITSSALQASWKTFKDDLLSAKTMEDIYRKHANYIKKIRFLCMLNRRSVEFYNNIENIFKVSLRFYRNLKSREWKKKGDDYYTHSNYDRLLADEAEFEKCIKYTIYLGNKIVRHGYQEEIGEFITLINYNHYYVADN